MAYILLLILMVVSVWKVFTKAGKPGWASIIPIYSFIVWLDIIKKPWWWMLLMFVPIVGLVYAIKATNLLSKSFGKGSGFTAGLIFLPFVFWPILAFGEAKYTEPTEVK